MARVMYIDPRGSHGLRNAMSRAAVIKAHIRQTDDGAQIEFSDGRSVDLVRESQVSVTQFMAAAMQWARRRGAVTVEVEFE